MPDTDTDDMIARIDREVEEYEEWAGSDDAADSSFEDPRLADGAEGEAFDYYAPAPWQGDYFTQMYHYLNSMIAGAVREWDHVEVVRQVPQPWDAAFILGVHEAFITGTSWADYSRPYGRLWGGPFARHAVLDEMDHFTGPRRRISFLDLERRQSDTEVWEVAYRNLSGLSWIPVTFALEELDVEVRRPCLDVLPEKVPDLVARPCQPEVPEDPEPVFQVRPWSVVPPRWGSLNEAARYRRRGLATRR